MSTIPKDFNHKDYRRVRGDRKAPDTTSPENEVRVTANHGQHSYISYTIAVLNGEEGKTKNDTVKISGMGSAIFNVVNIAEIVKRRVAGLHQITEIASETVRDEYEPLDSSKGLKNVVIERKVSTIVITLSRNKLDVHHAGYQAPLPEDQVSAQEKREPGATRERGSGGRGRGRGGRGRGRGGRGGRGSGGRGGRGAARGQPDRRDDRRA